MSTVIKVENVSKQYRLGEIGTGTISHDLNRWWARVRGKEDPYLQIGESNDRTVKGSSDYVWALQDINFEVQQGEVLGIIGRNGAGKSTLLKILSKTTAPTTGSIKIKGRIASLLEVGTGFHPELSGRDNIFLNGAILGMTKQEIKRKFDEIVDFSGVERYIDTPVKRYSSGMYVRLAFAVAAHLESEILILDEVLAVGDAEFQKKCLGKMGDVSKSEGRTVIFVSHNLGSISALCGNSFVLKNGKLDFYGNTESAINHYLKSGIIVNKAFYQSDGANRSRGYFSQIEIVDENNQQRAEFDVFDKVFINIDYKLLGTINSMHICVNMYKDGVLVWRTFDTDFNEHLLNARNSGDYSYKLELPHLLKAGNYIFNFYIGIVNGEPLDKIEDQLAIEVIEKSFDPSFKSFSKTREGIIVAQPIWNSL